MEVGGEGVLGEVGEEEACLKEERSRLLRAPCVLAAVDLKNRRGFEFHNNDVMHVAAAVEAQELKL